MQLTTKEKQHLKAKAHPLKPILLVGNQGVTESLQKEFERCLYDHELIKIRISGTDRESKKALFAQMCATADAVAVQLIGNIGIVYKPSDKHKSS